LASASGLTSSTGIEEMGSSRPCTGGSNMAGKNGENQQKWRNHPPKLATESTSAPATMVFIERAISLTPGLSYAPW